MTEKKGLLKRLAEGQVWTSIFRGGGVPKSRRQRMMVVLNSVFLHLHPVRLPKHAVKLKFTWCMGGLSFFLFLILTISGILRQRSDFIRSIHNLFILLAGDISILKSPASVQP